MAESDLVLRPGQHGDPVVGAGSTMAVDEVEQLVSGARHHGPHQQAGGSSPGDTQGLAQREDGVEHVAGRVARLLARSQLRRVAGGAVAAEELEPVGLVVDGVSLAVLDDEQVRRPHLRLLGRAPSTGGDQGAVLAEILRVHEHLGEGRMGEVIGGQPEDQLAVAGH